MKTEGQNTFRKKRVGLIILGVVDAVLAVALIVSFFASWEPETEHVKSGLSSDFAVNASMYGSEDTVYKYTAEGVKIVYDGTTVKSSVDTDTVDKDEKDEEDEGGMYSGFIFPDSSKELITDEELAEKVTDKDACQRAINEIYARHGYEFSSRDNVDFFEKYDWYNELEKNSNMDQVSQKFNQTEKENVAKLQRYSREQGW